MDLNFYSYDFRVNYSDVDENNQTTNRGFLRLMQEIAGIHSGILGYGVNDIPKTSLAWIVLNWKLKVYTRPPVNTKLVINTWTNAKNSLFMYRNFEVLDENKNLIAKAISKWVIYDINKKHVSRFNEDLKKKSLGFNKVLFEEECNEKLKEPENSKFVMDYLVLRRDIDTNHHVNNLNYLDYSLEAIPENYNFQNVEIMYKNEAKLYDTISVFYKLVNNEHFVTIKNKINNDIHAIIKFF